MKVKESLSDTTAQFEGEPISLKEEHKLLKEGIIALVKEDEPFIEKQSETKLKVHNEYLLCMVL